MNIVGNHSASAAGRVAAGIAWLNATVPDWVGKIDLDKLDIAKNCGCVIGQVYGPFNEIQPALMTIGEAQQRGFLCYNWTMGMEAEYKALTTCWIDQIEALRESETAVIDTVAAKAEEEILVEAPLAQTA